MPNLRTRKSTTDSRVTLFTLEPANETSASLASPVASTSISTPRAKRESTRVVKAEEDDGSADAGVSATPVKSRKRTRTSTLKEDESDYEEEKKSVKKSPAKSRPSSPTKLRAKLEIAHPEPPRWRETYEIVGLPVSSQYIQSLTDVQSQIRKQRETIVAAVDTVSISTHTHVHRPWLMSPRLDGL